jgi:hypothetical protein
MKNLMTYVLTELRMTEEAAREVLATALNDVNGGSRPEPLTTVSANALYAVSVLWIMTPVCRPLIPDGDECALSRSLVQLPRASSHSPRLSTQ